MISAGQLLGFAVAGALYLIWLGIHAIRQRKSLAAAFASVSEPQDAWRALRDGAVVGIANPKAYILFGAILPQFVNRATGYVPAQLLASSAASGHVGLSGLTPGQLLGMVQNVRRVDEV